MMGRHDYNAIEILPGETPQDAMQALQQAQRQVDGLTINHGFLGYWSFRHEGKLYLHIGWHSANQMAYRVLERLGKSRQVYSGYVDEEVYALIFFADTQQRFEPALTYSTSE